MIFESIQLGLICTASFVYSNLIDQGQVDGLCARLWTNGPGSSPGRGHHVLSKTLNCHSASLHPGV